MSKLKLMQQLMKTFVMKDFHLRIEKMSFAVIFPLCRGFNRIPFSRTQTLQKLDSHFLENRGKDTQEIYH
jgi:hypothetical protein